MKWDVVADRVAGGELVQMSTSTDGGRTWSPAVTIVARSGIVAFRSVNGGNDMVLTISADGCTGRR